MKSNFVHALRLTFLLLVFFSCIYTCLILVIAQLSSNKGNGEVVQSGNLYYYTNIGQNFSADKYFNSRPSAVNYNAAGAGGSNKGPTNPEYLAIVQSRIDTILIKNPTVTTAQIPSELVTASGSGLDPHLSVEAAEIQVPRIAKIRNVNENTIYQLIQSNIEQPLFGIFGTTKVNVLKLNLALDNLN
jgi:K+-transporting ATPase ATPase C chain